MYTVSITSQGQITIPASIRELLGLKKATKAIVSVEDDKMVVEPITDIFSLEGSLKTRKKPLKGEQIHEFVAQAVADDYAKKFHK